MTIKSLFAYLSVLCVLASCKKNNDSGYSGNSNRPRIYIEDVKTASLHVIDSFAVTYDNDNRISSVASSNLKFTYTYSAKSFTLDLYQNNQLSIHEIAYLNGIPYVDSTLQFNNTHDTTTEKYVYTGNLLTRKISYAYSTGGTTIDTREDYTYDNNGNVIKEVETDGQGNIYTVTSYTYTTNPLSVTINPIYFAPGSKYLPATMKQTDGAGNLIATITYSYVFDGAGRLVSEIQTASNGEEAVKTYIY